MGRRQTACRACAGIKAVCSKEAPCARCKRLSLQCSLAANHLSAKSHGPVYPAPDSRVRHPKTSTGCANCRRRRKKCDERRPTCADCSRLGLVCVVGRGINPRQRSLGAGDGPPNQTASDEIDHDFAVTGLRAFDWVPVINEEYATASLAKGASLDDSSALTVVPAANGTASDSSYSTALENLAGITPAALKHWKRGERHLLNHFLQYVARSLVLVGDEENPFISIIVPMAFESATMRHALSALSACHLARIYPDFERDLLTHRSHALLHLKSGLETPGDPAVSISATLLLCLLEICAGNTRRWLLYLHGAKALLSGLTLKTDEATLAFLIDLYDYLTCVATITSDDVPSPFRQSLGMMKPSASGIHPLFGIASEIYTNLTHINNLAHRCYDLDSTLSESTCQSTLESEAKAIELALQGWAPPSGDNVPEAMAEARVAAFAVQWATVLRLREIVPLVTDGNQTQRPVDYILSALSLLRPGSRAEARMLFPIFMAGVCSTTKAGRLTLEVRINLMKATIGFGNIASAHRTLDEIWRKANEGERCQWKEVMRSSNPGIVLF